MNIAKHRIVLILMIVALCGVGVVWWAYHHDSRRAVKRDYYAFVKKTLLGHKTQWSTSTDYGLQLLREQLVQARVPEYARDAHLRLVIGVDMCIAAGTCQRAQVDIDALIQKLLL